MCHIIIQCSVHIMWAISPLISILNCVIYNIFPCDMFILGQRSKQRLAYHKHMNKTLYFHMHHHLHRVTTCLIHSTTHTYFHTTIVTTLAVTTTHSSRYITLVYSSRALVFTEWLLIRPHMVEVTVGRCNRVAHSFYDIYTTHKVVVGHPTGIYPTIATLTMLFLQ